MSVLPKKIRRRLLTVPGASSGVNTAAFGELQLSSAVIFPAAVKSPYSRRRFTPMSRSPSRKVRRSDAPVQIGGLRVPSRLLLCQRGHQGTGHQVGFDSQIQLRQGQEEASLARKQVRVFWVRKKRVGTVKRKVNMGA